MAANTPRSDRSHYTLGQDGWEEVADCALSWALCHGAAPRQALSA